MSACGRLMTDWFFPDAYLPNPKDGVSHEAVCVLNIGTEDAAIDLTLYFEDKEFMAGFHSVCPANRTSHIRIDKIKNKEGKSVPSDVPYAIWVHSSKPILCQYTRVDASAPPRTMITTMGL